MRREADNDIATGGTGKLLIKLRHMAVMADAIGMEAFRDFSKNHLFTRSPARSGHSGFGVDDDLVRIDRFGLEKRNERQFGGRGVAAGIGDKPRLLDLIAVNLGEPVDG